MGLRHSNEYATSSILNIDSDAYTYTVLWFGVVEGVCVAGDTDVAVQPCLCSTEVRDNCF